MIRVEQVRSRVRSSGSSSSPGEAGRALLAERGERFGVVVGSERADLRGGGEVERRHRRLLHPVVDRGLRVAHGERRRRRPGDGRRPAPRRRARSSGTTRLTRPMRSASTAPIGITGEEVLAWPGPARPRAARPRCRRRRPPGRPARGDRRSVADSAITITSHNRAMLAPRPTAGPFDGAHDRQRHVEQVPDHLAGVEAQRPRARRAPAARGTTRSRRRPRRPDPRRSSSTARASRSRCSSGNSRVSSWCRVAVDRVERVAGPVDGDAQHVAVPVEPEVLERRLGPAHAARSSVRASDRRVRSSRRSWSRLPRVGRAAARR